MIAGHRVIVVMPAYRAAATLERTVSEIDRERVDDVIVVDDGSDDATASIARRLDVIPIVHRRNVGYGGAQKTGYRAALDRNADIVVMVHADYQYSPKLVVPMATMIATDLYDAVLGSRILGGGALRGGMPALRYAANRFLTLVENAATGAKLSEYHTGYRALSRRVLERLPLENNSDDFAFDAEMLAQCLFAGFRVGEVSCPTRYAADSSSITIPAGIRYSARVLRLSGEYALARLGGPVSRTFAFAR